MHALRASLASLLLVVAAPCLGGLAHAAPRDVPDGYDVVAAPPFVVIAARGKLDRYAKQLVGWTVSRLKRDFFARDPQETIDVWLLEDAATYQRIAQQLTGDPPDTPYGFYSPRARALVMNIATGGGTLVHEIVHPYMRANFPRAPAWYNEGLGSLFEQAGDVDGHLVGYTNWRLAGLQAAIARGGTIDFEALCSLDDDHFYKDDRGTHYSQARYLLYYLQEKGLLLDFHRRFLRDRDKDPTGVATLRSVLGVRSLRVFRPQWEQFVLALRFDG